jgi:hypothetical protein
MLTIAEMAADGLGKSLAEDYRRLFGASRVDAAERLDGIARIGSRSNASARATRSTTTSSTRCS